MTAQARFSPSTRRTALDRALDAERAAVTAFVRRYPEYEKLPHDVILQAAATYRDPADHAARAELAGEGIDGARLDDWTPNLESDEGPRWSDDA